MWWLVEDVVNRFRCGDNGNWTCSGQFELWFLTRDVHGSYCSWRCGDQLGILYGKQFDIWWLFGDMDCGGQLDCDYQLEMWRLVGDVITSCGNAVASWRCDYYIGDVVAFWRCGDQLEI